MQHAMQANRALHHALQCTPSCTLTSMCAIIAQQAALLIHASVGFKHHSGQSLQNLLTINQANTPRKQLTVQSTCWTWHGVRMCNWPVLQTSTESHATFHQEAPATPSAGKTPPSSPTRGYALSRDYLSKQSLAGIIGVETPTDTQQARGTAQHQQKNIHYVQTVKPTKGLQCPCCCTLLQQQEDPDRCAY